MTVVVVLLHLEQHQDLTKSNNEYIKEVQWVDDVTSVEEIFPFSAGKNVYV